MQVPTHEQPVPEKRPEDYPTHVCYRCGAWWDVYAYGNLGTVAYIVEHSPEGLDLNEIFAVASAYLLCPVCQTAPLAEWLVCAGDVGEGE